ncbi:type II secretion system secretin GspD [Dethiosulfovibrio sp. F2B]|uniref:type II secretion system secretin GspD n=1 Tax=Dethiosulfovibrio faecalis TaxID=2720018 RepID=UPI001F17307C|nr:type II secretion system secretin GspD [Dethiosulfovibrio faecalis]MCF4150754.1 type II secretion system secretin GspD [Dethiosulfovibrio faecalis]
MDSFTIAWAQDLENQEEQNLIAAARAMRASGSVQFNFTNLDVVKFIRFMAELLQKNIIISPEVGGTVTVMSPRSVSLEESFKIMLTTLSLNGLSLEDMGDYYKVVKGGVTQENKAQRGKIGPGYGEQYVNQVVPLDFVTSDIAHKALQQAAGNSVKVLPLSDGNGVLLSGQAVDVQRMVNLARALDVPDSIRKVMVLPISEAEPALLAQHLANLAKDPMGPFRGLSAVADPASRKIVLVGEMSVLESAKKVVSKLDVPPTSGEFHVYKLKNADAKEVSEQLSQILAVAGRLQSGKDGSVPTTVVPDIPTNSLIFTAPERQFSSLLDIIEQLDTQPKQVLVRGLIAEVNLTNLKNAGIDWATWGGQVSGNTVFAANAALGGSTGVPSTFVDWFQELSKHEEELYNSDGNLVGTKTTYDGNSLIYAYVQLLKKYDAMNILSMPRLMCTDNKESSLLVGQVIPQMKASTSDISNPSSVQNSYDYKDTGLKLKITPHIRSGNLVALDIEQSTEEVLSAMTSTTPVTAKREIKTSVQVRNGQTIILGGLLKEAEKSLKQRVPILSYIPLVGELFKSSTNQREKIELMVFLTPYILETPEAATEASKAVAASDADLGLSEAEIQLNRRFQEMYQEAVKKQR